MSAHYEVLLTTETTGQLCNICVWDTKSGTQLLTYKGGSSAPRTLCLLQQDYIISAVHNKPILHVWSMQRKDQIQQRMICPGPVMALATSPNGLYCVAGIQDKLHIWQVATGSISNVRLIQPPKRMLSYDCEVRHVQLPLQQFRRQVSSGQNLSQLPEAEMIRETYSVTTRPAEVDYEFSDKLYEECVDHIDLLAAGRRKDPKQVEKELTEQIDKLQQVNNDMYHFAVRRILEGKKIKT
ncbi:hypothetical protein LSH36_6g05065 [Paralvinella palmiformis]|uniref:WD repeat-containing protein 18 n=1 Tax=Paralvinella palmiformis TaxID=53620 RepID=A0AAD9KDT8_9ANNE|nr:hypothetical protein LSH36_6g05065 [Paralvinella palmiformis]